MVDDCDLERCEDLAIRWEETSLNSPLMEKFCEKNFVFTNSIRWNTKSVTHTPQTCIRLILHKYLVEHGKGGNVQLSAEMEKPHDLFT